MVISFPLLWHHFRWNSRNLFTGLLYTKTAQARKTEEQRQQQQKQSNTHTNKIGIIALMNIYLFIGWYLVVNLISCVSIRVLVFVTICYMLAVLIYSVYYTMWIHAWDRIGLDWIELLAERNVWRLISFELVCIHVFHFQSKCVKWKWN